MHNVPQTGATNSNNASPQIDRVLVHATIGAEKAIKSGYASEARSVNAVRNLLRLTYIAAGNEQTTEEHRNNSGRFGVRRSEVAL